MQDLLLKPGQNTTDRVTPIMPCPDIRRQAEFYQQLGFDVLGLYTSPNPYVALRWGAIELHFYGSRKTAPAQNATMCYVKVEDVDIVNEAFTTALKQHTGKVPRAGIPRISKVRDLVDDRRFTLTDPGGNTLYIGSPVKDRFFRSLEDTAHAKRFAVLYDVLYSKEDPIMAAEILPRYADMKDTLAGLDKARFLLLELDIRKQTAQPLDDGALVMLMDSQAETSGDWKRVRERYSRILERE